MMYVTNDMGAVSERRLNENPEFVNPDIREIFQFHKASLAYL